jgi:hypothetical protein
VVLLQQELRRSPLSVSRLCGEEGSRTSASAVHEEAAGSVPKAGRKAAARGRARRFEEGPLAAGEAEAADVYQGACGAPV